MLDLSAISYVVIAFLVSISGIILTSWLMLLSRRPKAKERTTMTRVVPAAMAVAGIIVALLSNLAWRYPVVYSDGSFFLRIVKPRADLSKSDLAGADLRWANLEESILTEAILRGADLKRVNLRFADLSKAVLHAAILQEGNLLGANLREAKIRAANLTNAHLGKANLAGADLRGTRLDGAVLTMTILKEANLKGANLKDANLRGADLGGAIGLTRDQLYQALLDRETTILPSVEGFDWDEYFFMDHLKGVSLFTA